MLFKKKPIRWKQIFNKRFTSIYYEEEIFNDIYSYDGIETGVGFKHYFNESVELSLEAKYMIRNYSSLPAVR